MTLGKSWPVCLPGYSFQRRFVLADILPGQYQRKPYIEPACQQGFPFLDIPDHQDQEYVHHLSLRQPGMNSEHQHQRSSGVIIFWNFYDLKCCTYSNIWFRPVADKLIHVSFIFDWNKQTSKKSKHPYVTQRCSTFLHPSGLYVQFSAYFGLVNISPYFWQAFPTVGV